MIKLMFMVAVMGSNTVAAAQVMMVMVTMMTMVMVKTTSLMESSE
jgi:hypothetical protein